MATKPLLHSPGIVLPNGALSKPLIDYLDSIVSATGTVDVSALTARVTALEASEGDFNGYGTNGIVVLGDADSGLNFNWQGTTSNVPEGSRLYFTDARAKAAAVADDLQPDVTDVAPSQDAVLRALAGLGGGPVAASAVSITDAGGYFTGTDVEAALQELGASPGGGGLTIGSALQIPYFAIL